MLKASAPFVLVSLFAISSLAQDQGFSFSGYVDTYYGFDFNKPANHQKQYVTQTARHNEFNINLALVKASYSSENIRGNFGFQTGTYPAVNYGAEPTLARFINEANVGVRFGRHIWVDAGVMGGHFGYESVLSLKNEVYTQAMATEYTPYYQTGVQITMAVLENLSVRGVVVNGWQNIFETNDGKAFGVAADYQVSDEIKVSYGNYFGDEGNEIVGKKMRIHNNAYVSYDDGTASATAILDYTNQELINASTQGNTVIITLIGKYNLTDEIGFGGRYEHISDPDEILFSTIAPGFHTNIFTASVNYYPEENIAFKVEGKSYYGKEDIWTTGESISNSTFMLNLGLAILLE